MSAEATAPPRRRRRWLRRLGWLAAIVVAGRIGLGLAAFPVARAVAARYGVELSCEELDLALLAGRVEVWRIEAAIAQEEAEEEGADEPRRLFAARALTLDVDTSALLRGHVRVRRLEVDGGALELARDAAGAWNFDPLLARLTGDGVEPDPEPPRPYEPRPIALDPPVEVVAAVVHGFSVHLCDEASDPPLDATLTASFTAADVGSPGRRARVDVVATSPELLDLMRVRGSGVADGPSAEVELDVELASLRLRPLAHLLAPLGIEPVARRIDGGFRIAVRVSPANEGGDRVAAAVELSGAHLVHDGREALALDSFTVDVAEAWPRGALVREARAGGVRGRAERLPDGAVAFAGIAWRGASRAPAATEPEPDAETADEGEPAAGGPEGATRFEWSVDAVRVTGGLLAFEDRALAPAIETVAELEELELGPLSPSAGAPRARLAVTAAVPDVVERVVVSGTLRPPGTGPPELDLALDAEGVAPRRIAPYLALAGIEPAFERARLGVESVSLGPAAGGGLELAVRGLALTDGGAELGAIDSVVVDLQPDGDPDGEPSIAVDGARLEVTREPTDAVVLLGLRFGAAPPLPRRAVPPADVSAAPAASAPPRADSAPFSMPELSLPSARLQLERLTLIDEAEGSPPTELGPVVVTLSAAAASAAGARAWELDVDGEVRLARELVAHLRVEQAASGAVAASVTARARGLDVELLRPWLALAGLEPALAEGSFDGALTAALAAVDGRPSLDLELGPVRLAQGAGDEEREWLGLERLAVERLVLGGGVSIERVRIESPRIAVQRDADGGLCALGLRLPPPAPPEGPSAEELGEDARAEAEAAAAGTATGPERKDAGKDAGRATVEASAPASAGSAPPLRVGAIELVGARVLFEDLALAEPHAVELGADLSIADLSPGAGARPTTVDGRVSVGPWQLASRGEVVLDPDDLRASLELSGEGLSGEPLAPYLPPELAVALADGVAAARVEARVARAGDGGRSASLHVEGAELRERGAERPVAALAALRVVAPRIDPAAGVYEVDELVVEGAALDVVRTAAGGVRALGVLVTPAPEAAPAQPAESGGAQAPRAEGAAEGAAAGAGDAASPGATGRPPRIRVGRLDLELAELFVTSEVDPSAAPSVSAARLVLREPYELDVDPEAGEDEDPPPIGLDLSASVSPGLGSLALGIDLAPFAERPWLEARLAARGISGAGVLALAPELAEDVDASGLTEGTLDGTLRATLSWRRRGPFDFDLRGGFGAELVAHDVALRATPDGEVALGVDRVEALVRRVVPRTGLVHVSRLEIDTPRARVRRSAEAVELAGLAFRVPEPAEGTAAPSADAGGEAEQALEPPAQRPARPPAPAPGEVRLDDLVVHGIDVRVEDATVDPPLVLPLETLEVDVRGFTTRALREPVPIRVSASLGAGSVSLPVRLERRSFVRGLATGVVDVVSGKDEEVRLEDRPFFQEGAVSARITLVPRPAGWARVSLTGFELVGLRGLAREGGVEIGDGVLDFGARVRLKGAEGARVESVSSFAHLSLSEPAGGPISRYLKLPAPLDTVLFALKNEQGEHRIPLAFDVGGEGQVSAGQVAAKASSTLLALITEALASAPMRAVGGVTDAVGLGGVFGGGDRKPRYAGLQAKVPFEAGGVRVGPRELAKMAEVVEAMHADPLLEIVGVHTLGRRDLERAERLASPETEEAATLLTSLRRRRDELVRRRDELAATARVHLVLGQEDEYAQNRDALLDVDGQLGRVEDGIDRVAELLRPGAESRRASRTREAALAIARTRMDELTRALLERGVPYERVDMRPPRIDVASNPQEQPGRGRVVLVTRGGTPPKGFFRRMLGWIGL